MYLAASDHACPHLHEMRLAEVRPAIVEPSAASGCPFGAGRAAAELPRPASTVAHGGGWWAFKAEAIAMSARL